MIISVNIKNYTELKEIFKKAPAQITGDLNTAVNRIILKVENSAKRFAPVNKQSGGGNLRQSIRSQMTGVAKGMVNVGATYATYVHEGTRPHIIVPVRKKVLANKRTNQVFGVLVHHPGTKAQPFLQQAVDENQGFIDNEFDKIGQGIIK